MSADPRLSEDRRLVSEYATDLVYWVPSDFLIPLDFFFSRRKLPTNSCLVRDLKTSAFNLIDQEALKRFSVDDDYVGHLLQEYDVVGIRHPLLSATADLPLYGNVTDPSWASINLGGSCDSSCFFCYTDWTRSFPDLSSEEAHRVLERLAEIGTIRTVVFTGGEPTLRKDLNYLFERAQELGFSDLALQTNGRALANPKRLSDLVDRGLKSVLLSIHGAKAQTHDRITGANGSYRQALQALGNLQKLGISVTTNTVICRPNLDEIEEIPSSLFSMGFGDLVIRFSYSIIEGAAFDHREDALVSFRMVRPHLSKAVSRSHQLGFNTQLGTIPACVSPTRARQARTYEKSSLRQLVHASVFYKFNVPRGEVSVKLSSCKSCREFYCCPGIQTEYLRRFPADYQVFAPISDEGKEEWDY